MVAGEQPVELEGGEWIIPKEAVPDYLPVLKQITNQGRAMQQMQNGNTAIDALMASASMENGLTPPRSPMYGGGGRLQSGDVGSVIDDLSIFGDKSAVDALMASASLENGLSQPSTAEQYWQKAAARGGTGSVGSDYLGDYMDRMERQRVDGVIPEYDREHYSGFDKFQDFKESIESGEKIKEFGAEAADRRRQRGISPSVQEMMTRSWENNPGGLTIRRPEERYGYQTGGQTPELDIRRGPQSLHERDASMDRMWAGLDKQLDEWDKADLKNFRFLNKEGSRAWHTYARGKDPARDMQKLSRRKEESLESDKDYQKWLQEENRLKMEGQKLDEMWENARKSTKQSSGVFDAPRYAQPPGTTGHSMMGDIAHGYGDSSSYLPLTPDAASNQQIGLGEKLRHYTTGYGNPLANALRGLGNKERGGAINQYGHGGKMQPRRQQEIRNPEVYGPPTSMMTQMETDTTGNSLQDILNQLQMRDVNQSINPFTGDSLDFEGDSLRLLQRMNESRGDTSRTRMPLSPYGRKMQQGGLVGPETYGPPEPTGRQNIEAMQASGMLGQGQPLERRSLMGDANQDSRIAPMPMIEPDQYKIRLIPNAPQDTTMMEIPKLSSAYLASLGVETPLSKRQNSSLQERQIPPQMLNSKVSGLINRALIQRLSKEPL